MQKIFYSDNLPTEYSKKNNDLFPPPPERCPFHDCAIPLKLKKHGYYKRYFICKSFSGILYIRLTIKSQV